MWNKPLNKKFITGLYKKIKKDLRKHPQGDFLIIAFILAWVLWGISAGLLWLLFLAFAFYDWDNRVIGVMALFSLATCPFLLSFKQDALAEKVAVYAYFFLVMTVVLQIIEYKRHPNLFKESKNEEK
jgi:hypothetical protein